MRNKPTLGMRDKNGVSKKRPASKFQYLPTILFATVILYVFINSIIADYLVKKSGQCVKAYIYKETSPGRTAPDLGYRFFVGAKDYNGFISKNEKNQITDSICIVYYVHFPNFNRPISYFKKGELNCSCE